MVIMVNDCITHKINFIYQFVEQFKAYDDKWSLIFVVGLVV
jgi:hypothetical protein